MDDILASTNHWYDNTALLVGVVAFIATISGALISATAQIIQAKLKEKADVAADKRRNKQALTQAAQMIRVELLMVHAVIAGCLDAKQYLFGSIHLESWDEYRHILAPVMRTRDWNLLGLAALAASEFMKEREDFLCKNPRDQKITDEDTLAHMHNYNVSISEGMGTLTPFLEQLNELRTGLLTDYNLVEVKSNPNPDT